MAKSAQQRFNESIAESTETREVIQSFIDASYTKYGSHSYAAGYLQSTLSDVIMRLPKAQREEMRQQLQRSAQDVTVN